MIGRQLADQSSYSHGLEEVWIFDVTLIRQGQGFPDAIAEHSLPESLIACSFPRTPCAKCPTSFRHVSTIGINEWVPNCMNGKQPYRFFSLEVGAYG